MGGQFYHDESAAQFQGFSRYSGFFVADNARRDGHGMCCSMDQPAPLARGRWIVGLEKASNQRKANSAEGGREEKREG